MRNDDDDARREAKADRELREQIRRSIEEEDEREPTLEELEKWTRQMNEEAGDPPPSAQTPPAPTQLPPQTNAASPSADSSRNGKGRGGPSRAEGKAISKTNATTHGIFSSVVVLPNESRTDYAALLRDSRNISCRKARQRACWSKTCHARMETSPLAVSGG